MVLICVHLARSRAWAGVEKKHRIVTISTLCLLDDEQHQNCDYVVDMVEQAAQRQRHDLIVAPLTPFLSFREGYEAQDFQPASSLWGRRPAC